MANEELDEECGFDEDDAAFLQMDVEAMKQSDARALAANQHSLQGSSNIGHPYGNAFGATHGVSAQAANHHQVHRQMQMPGSAVQQNLCGPGKSVPTNVRLPATPMQGHHSNEHQHQAGFSQQSWPASQPRGGNLTPGTPNAHMGFNGAPGTPLGSCQIQSSIYCHQYHILLHCIKVAHVYHKVKQVFSLLKRQRKRMTTMQRLELLCIVLMNGKQ
jgi:hypothetical protein